MVMSAYTTVGNAELLPRMRSNGNSSRLVQVSDTPYFMIWCNGPFALDVAPGLLVYIWRAVLLAIERNPYAADFPLVCL
jgi:hypothetical protein